MHLCGSIQNLLQKCSVPNLVFLFTSKNAFTHACWCPTYVLISVLEMMTPMAGAVEEAAALTVGTTSGGRGMFEIALLELVC